MTHTTIGNSRGVALLVALFVLMIMSIISIGILTSVDEEIKISKNSENSERALKIAEAGVQIARASFFDPSALGNFTGTMELSSIDGFIHGGYFLTRMQSGFPGNEKWTQWHYDAGLSGNNEESEITVPLQRVWATGAKGVNGIWDWDSSNTRWRFYVSNLFGIVAGGTYFSIETADGTSSVRAHNEYTGERTVTDPDDNIYWQNDKTITNTDLSPEVNTAVWMSPMASFSDYTTMTTTEGSTELDLSQQTLYFTYAGNETAIASDEADRDSTVRLRAINALCNSSDDSDAPAATLWEFDTGMHGLGTAPAFFDPDPDTPGDEIIYFAVISMGDPGDPGALDLNETGNDTFLNFPSMSTHASEQIHLFALIDTTGTPSTCSSKGSYKLKWTRPFPDPDVINWTDYPMEHATGTLGQTPPYVRVPADMTPFLPEDDLLVDYRDGPGYSGRFNNDNEWNQVRGNITHKAPSACSPPVVNVLYRLTDSTLTPTRRETNDGKGADGDPFDPLIDIYLMYSERTRVVHYQGSKASPTWAQKLQWTPGKNGWGPPGYRKPITQDVRVIALRDRVVRTGSTWDWNAARSRFPTFKWTYRVPAHDPDMADVRPWNGYGEYTWDTSFMQQIAPMIRTSLVDQSKREWEDVVDSSGNELAGDLNRYAVIYPSYRSDGFATGTGYDNTVQSYTRGPTTAKGSVADFSDYAWTDARAMMMAIRDTWEDYMVGNQTNALVADMQDSTKNALYANGTRSNPVEPYWNHDHADYEATRPDEWVTLNESDGAPNEALYKYISEDTVITYNMTGKDTANNDLNAPYPANANKIGFPRPYEWSESLWEANVRQAALEKPWSMYQQGWNNAGFDSGTPDHSTKIDIKGETAAMCQDCLDGDGLIIFPFLHNLTQEESWDYKDPDNDRIDLRLHALNATTGLHKWDYHMAGTLIGDNINATPAIANNNVFVAYEMFGSDTNDDNRQALLDVLDVTDGSRKQQMVVDPDADAVVLSPTIANGAVYVGTYSWNGTKGGSSESSTPDVSDDFVRLFALSPVLRLVSTGIYPMSYQSHTTLTDHDAILKDALTTTYDGKIPRSKRQLQVWITGSTSKWEETGEVIFVPTPIPTPVP